MTMCVVLELIDQFGMDMNKVKIHIIETSTTVILGGTSAELLKGDLVSVHDLLYGMMLPSGNDAAQSLAIYFGNLMSILKKRGDFNRFALSNSQQ